VDSPIAQTDGTTADNPINANGHLVSPKGGLK
jgi:hypothetical protein